MVFYRRSLLLYKSQFKTLALYRLFKKYTDKISFGYFSLFLILTFCLFITHTILLLVECLGSASKIHSVVPDLIIYSAVCLLSVLGLITLEIVERRQQKWFYFCAIAFGVLLLANFFPPIYHDLNNTASEYSYTPAYTFLIVIGCYLFFGVQKNWMAVLLGASVSSAHITTLVLVTYRGSDILVTRVFSDIIFLTCFNGLGLYFRYLNEIVQRKSFLDRRDCIVNTFQLKHEKQQEEQLMSSIIPAPLINKVKQHYLRSQENYKKFGKLGNDKPEDLLEVHEGVTILFADIVNYTVMTKKLNINALLETLNELFGRFDDASDRLKVIRIKFLGDCYYCVSGLPPEPPPNPAEACVDLGLKMIKIIADVREKNNLTIDMRIGIHTGKIISGIIGKVKYQFDVWSKDVDIANKMESEGLAGKVHITSRTKALLNKAYDITPTDKGNTVPQFKDQGLQTYLVTPVEATSKASSLDPPDILMHTPQPRPSIFRKNGSVPILSQLQQLDLPQISEEPRTTLTIIESNNIEQDNQRRLNGDTGRRSTVYQRRPSQRFRPNEERRITSDVKRRTAFMSTNFKRYNERSASVDNEMEKTIDNMSFSKKDQYVVKGSEISGLLVFKDRKAEWEYVKMKDPMFKYYVLSQVVLILCVYLIQNLTLESRAWLRYEFITSQLILVVILIPSTWTYYIYLKFRTQFQDVMPSNVVVRFFYTISRFITYNFLARLVIYTLVWMLFLACVFLEVWFCHTECFQDTSLTSEGYCMVPWHITESCALALIMTFLFLKIFIWIKLLYAILTTIVYSYCALYYVTPIYKSSETFNPFLAPQISHVLSIVFLTFTLHLIDRQTDYMNRLDFLWTAKLLEEKRKANEQQMVNTNMLINILPKHVAKVYLDANKEMDLYFETHNHSAVMFASMIFDEDLMEHEMSFLQLMNVYITIIDTLVNRKEFSKVEKIKIAKWTYMAACGLTVPGENENIGHSVETHHTSNTLEVLLNFASTMFQEFNKQNTSFTQIHLRIGIAHGPIIAGVVGSKKPLYDIWGDAVNMASRMDSTGCPGQIQVLGETAQEIEKLGYECVPRGIRTVKGVGEVPTFFVKLDSDFKLAKRQSLPPEE
ncbi:adenylate cyclase type 2 isoform X2 [Dendroctonus ponderosae]|uniref:adenylate cyclase type 2 isoform X2 n=1 Tax=Dendroctonus ponderosae TaxID=77166 RepID=UPI002034C528|nr:adenylate cyclase type 2 isoform X2 [Dendroctonus ponderosae]XP_019763568.2 adenylate cyclase type 2 isoform X2 [Dendroctonus ponderosae]